MTLALGVLGTATIARAELIPAVADTDHRVLAVASRDGERARRFAADLDVPRAYDGYAALLADDDLDAVYIPLPNAHHAEWVRRAADAGLDVLCEKPLGVDADETADLAAYCAARDAILMEAFMYRYHPRTERALAVAANLDVRTVRATFEFPLPRDVENVRLSPELAGGSLMDVGVYPITAVRAILGTPDRVLARTVDARDAGVDTRVTGLFAYEAGPTATIHAGFDTNWTQSVRVDAADGRIDVPRAFRNFGEAARFTHTHAPDRPTGATDPDERTVEERFDPINQYAREVEHFAGCVRTRETPRTDGRDAARTLAVVDALRDSARTDGWTTVTAPTAR